jgi:hypothetical protein
MKKIVKKFNNLFQKTIFKVENKTNNKFKISNFYNQFKKRIFKVNNKTNDKFKISIFNKFLTTFIALLFLYIFYLLTPLLYDKNWVKNNIETKLFNEFRIGLIFSEDISYRILPSPHFLIKDSELLLNSSKNQNRIAEVRNLKIFLSKKNFFNKDKMSIERVIISKANFSLLGNDIKILNNSTNDKFSNKKIEIKKSTIFLKNEFKETVSIIKINKANIFYDENKLHNHFNLVGKIFAVPFTFKLINANDSFLKKEMNFSAKSLNLNILNNIIDKNNDQIIGNNIISFLNSKIDTEYEVVDEDIIFKSKNSRINNSKIDYNGKLSINPFDLDLKINLDNHKVSKLFKFNTVMMEFLKSELLFNENISLDTSITVNPSKTEGLIHKAKIQFHILNGKINFDNSQFVNNDIGILRVNNSNLFLKKNKLILNMNLIFDIKNSNRLYSFLNTNKRLRRKIENIFLNLEYDILNNQIEFNKVKVDNNETSIAFMNIIEDFNDNNSNNLIKTRRLINKLLSNYEG